MLTPSERSYACHAVQGHAILILALQLPAAASRARQAHISTKPGRLRACNVLLERTPVQGRQNASPAPRGLSHPLQALQRARIARKDHTLLQAQALALFAHRARTTPTRRPLPSPRAQRVPQARTAPASAPRPAGPVWSALPAHTTIAPAPHQLLHASCVPRARTTPTLGRRLVPLAKRVPRGRTTMMWDPKRRADAR